MVRIRYDVLEERDKEGGDDLSSLVRSLMCPI